MKDHGTYCPPGCHPGQEPRPKGELTYTVGEDHGGEMPPIPRGCHAEPTEYIEFNTETLPPPEPHTHGGTDAPECTTCPGRKYCGREPQPFEVEKPPESVFKTAAEFAGEFFNSDEPLRISTVADDFLNSVSPRQELLEEAIGLITGSRNAQYGPPTQDFDRTSAALTAMGYRRIDPGDVILPLEPHDVAIIVMMVKISRLMSTPGKRDSWVDIAGYAGCGYECTTEE